MTDLIESLREAVESVERVGVKSAKRSIQKFADQLHAELPAIDAREAARVAQLLTEGAAGLRRDALADAGLEHLGPIGDHDAIAVDYSDQPGSAWQPWVFKGASGMQGGCVLTGEEARKFLAARAADRVGLAAGGCLVFREPSGRAYRVTRLDPSPGEAGCFDPEFPWPAPGKRVFVDRGESGPDVRDQILPMYPGIVRSAPSEANPVLVIEVGQGFPCGILSFHVRDFQERRLAWRYEHDKGYR